MDRVEEWRVFTSVASHGSFNSAARARGWSPQAVTRAIASLEARIGTGLINRTTRCVSLTGDGARYLEHARSLLTEFDRLEDRTDAVAELRGAVSMTAPALFGRLHVLPIIAALLDEQPLLDVRLLLLDRVVSLAEEGLDLGVRIGSLPPSALRARRLGSVRLVVCASHAYLASSGTPMRPLELTQHACIAFMATTPIAERWSFPAHGAREQSISVRARLVVNTAEAAIDAAVAGLGVVRVLSYQVDDALRAGKLRLLLEPYEPPPAPVHLVSLPGQRTRAAEVTVDYLARRLRERLVAMNSPLAESG